MSSQSNHPNPVSTERLPISGQIAALWRSRWTKRGLALAAVGCAWGLATKAYWAEADVLQDSTFIVTTRAETFAGSNEPLRVALGYAPDEQRLKHRLVPATATGRVAQYQFPVLLRGLKRVTLLASDTRVKIVRITNSGGATIARLGREHFHPMPEAARFHGDTLLVLQSTADPKSAQEWTGVDHLAVPATVPEAIYVSKQTAFYATIFIGIGWLVHQLVGAGLAAMNFSPQRRHFPNPVVERAAK